MKTIFHQGPIDPAFIGTSIARHQSKTSIGAHSIFLGQVRADEIDGKQVAGIDYTADVPLADALFHDIREATFARYDLTCAHIHHSLGSVAAGEVCLFVFTSSAHRAAATAACAELVERIKAELPIWGKESFVDGSYQWKQNLPL